MGWTVTVLFVYFKLRKMGLWNHFYFNEMLLKFPINYKAEWTETIKSQWTHLLSITFKYFSDLDIFFHTISIILKVA
jgi:hypothetical protein